MSDAQATHWDEASEALKKNASALPLGQEAKRPRFATSSERTFGALYNARLAIDLENMYGKILMATA